MECVQPDKRAASAQHDRIILGVLLGDQHGRDVAHIFKMHSHTVIDG
jgi:hypothetical protein